MLFVGVIGSLVWRPDHLCKVPQINGQLQTNDLPPNVRRATANFSTHSRQVTGCLLYLYLLCLIRLRRNLIVMCAPSGNVQTRVGLLVESIAREPNTRYNRLRYKERGHVKVAFYLHSCMHERSDVRSYETNVFCFLLLQRRLRFRPSLVDTLRMR